MSAVIHLSDPDTGLSFCGEPVTLVEAEGDTRPICQTCHRGAMKTMRSGWCPCAAGRPQHCKPEDWPMSRRHGTASQPAEVGAYGRAMATISEMRNRAARDTQLLARRTREWRRALDVIEQVREMRDEMFADCDTEDQLVLLRYVIEGLDALLFDTPTTDERSTDGRL